MSRAGGGHRLRRRRYAPVRHPGVPRRWDRPAIVRALHDWVAETGSRAAARGLVRRAPARRGQRSAQVDGRAPAMAEQLVRRGAPRLVERGAGGSGPPGPQAHLRQLGGRARRRRTAPGGRTAWACAAIARALGGLRVERRQLPARTPVPGVRRTRHQPARDALRRTAPPTSRPSHARGRARRSRGRPRLARRARAPADLPRVDALADAPGVWEAESPRWPSAAVVCDLYRDRDDPWNAALVDAGAPVRFRRWSDDAVRAALGSLLGADRASAHGRRSARSGLARSARADAAPPLRRRRGRMARARPGAGRGRVTTAVGVHAHDARVPAVSRRSPTSRPTP